MEQRTIVICGATGKQGGAVLRSLEKAGRWNLVVLSRDVKGAKADAIRQRGIEVRYADLDDAKSLAEAFSGAYGVYGVTTMLTSSGKLDYDVERSQGRNIADSCIANNVQHLVLSTIPDFGEEPCIVPYIHSKLAVEDYVKQKALPYTFLAPGSFMDELGGEFLPVKKRVVTGQADNDAKIPYVACSDIGEFARISFDDPGQFIGRKLTIIGDFISGDELAQAMTRVAGGKPYRHKVPPIWLMKIFAREWITLRKQFEMWGRPPHPPDLLAALEESRSLLPSIQSFEDYMRAAGFPDLTTQAS